jgi:hypothetical protein
MVRRAEYNEEGELLYEYNDYWDEPQMRRCEDSYCAGNCGICT